MIRRNLEVKRQVGIWIRVSTEDQARGDSPEHHEHRARAYAAAKDWEVVEVYHLEGVSGKSVSDHPETRRMMGDIAGKRISALIFSKLARLARNTKQLLEFADRFREAEADLVSLQESIDTSTPAGRLFYTMIAAMAQWEREEIADRVAASVPIRAKLGKSLGGRAPFGYQWIDNQLLPHPDEAPIRREVHELFRAHRRKKTVAHLLNEADRRTRDGKKFSDTLVHRLLTDPLAKGLRRANYTTLGNENKFGYKPESEWVYSRVEPVITEELWDECKAILDGQSQGRKKRSKRPVHLFAGYVYCACGKKMYVPSNSEKYSCSPCHNRIAANDLEHIFIEKLKGFLLSPEEIKHYLDQAASFQGSKQSTIERLGSELKTIQSQINGLFALYDQGQIPTSGFKDRYNPIFEHQQVLQKQLAEAQGALDALRIDDLSADQILIEGQSLGDRWPHLSREEKRKIIEDLTEEITVAKDEVTINVLYFPSATTSKNATKRQQNHLPMYS